jgi:hypothetical protein
MGMGIENLKKLTILIRLYLRAFVGKFGQVKNDPLRFTSFIAILKALFNISMLANFQSNRMIGTVFIGLGRSMMVIFGIKHHLGIFFLASPKNLRLISKLYRMYKKESFTSY